MAPRSLLSLSVLPPKKLKNDFNGPSVGLSDIRSVVSTTVVLSAISWFLLPPMNEVYRSLDRFFHHLGQFISDC